MEQSYLIIFQFLLLIILIALSAFFSGSETALFSLSRARLLSYRKDKSRSKQYIVRLMDSYQGTLTILILGNMFVNIGTTMTYNSLVSYIRMPEIVNMLVTAFSTIILLLIFGEITPKSIALYYAEPLSNRVAGIIWVFKFVLSPVLYVIDRIFSLVLDLFGRRESEPLSHEEYATYLETAYAGGAFSDQETRLMSSAFALREKIAAEVMTARIDIRTVRKTDPAEKVIKIIRKNRCHYLPVIESDIDDAEHLLASKDFFILSDTDRQNWKDSPTCLVPAVFIPENASLTKTLATLRRNSASTALVTDEYGGVSGMVTIEDIYEEMVGEIEDEHEIPDWEVRQTGKNTWELDGMMPLFLLEDIADWKVPEDIEANTLNGMFCEKLDRLPVMGDEIEIDGLKLSAMAVQKKRVSRIKAVISGKRNTGHKKTKDGDN